MELYRLSKRADEDLVGLFEYGLLNFGVDRAESYLMALHERFELLALHPGLGRQESMMPGLRRFEYKAHIIFYQVYDQSVLIVRVLRTEVDVKRHLPFS